MQNWHCDGRSTGVTVTLIHIVSKIPLYSEKIAGSSIIMASNKPRHCFLRSSLQTLPSLSVQNARRNLSTIPYLLFRRIHSLPHSPFMAPPSMELGYMLLHDLDSPRVSQPIHQLRGLVWQRREPFTIMVRNLCVVFVSFLAVSDVDLEQPFVFC